MTGSSQLERGYRRVLACYPKAFRRTNEDEMLAVVNRHDGSLADRSSGDGAHLAQDSRPALPAGTGLAGACASKAPRQGRTPAGDRP